MAKSRPARSAKESRKSKTKGKTILHTTQAPRSKPASKPTVDPSTLLDQATSLLHTGQPDDALPLAVRALSLLHPASTPPTPAALPALTLLAEIHIELGDGASARTCFLRAVELDPKGVAPDGAEKFLWLAQLCEEGGEESVRWFERGAGVLRAEIAGMEERAQGETGVEEKRRKLAGALCGVVEVYMTDLSWDPRAEPTCEALVTEALLSAPLAPEPLQTLASVRISQQRLPDARAALHRSMELWAELAPEDPHVPDFSTRISLARLLMEAGMEERAMEVVERLVLEDDGSVEAWYLGGWCLYLMGEKRRRVGSGGGNEGMEGAIETGREGEGEGEEERRTVLMVASREWLRHSLKLYEAQEYEDERLRDHALELVEGLDREVGDEGAEEEDDGGGEWEDEDEDEEEDGGEEEDEEGEGADLRMNGT